MKFTKKEISLCKQVAERHRRKIKTGDWLLDETGDVCLAEKIKKEFATMFDVITISREVDSFSSFRYVSQGNPDITPLWTISDCLEFLKEKGLEWVDVRIHYPDTSVVIWARRVKDLDQMKNYETGDTLLEACLKAVLTILKEEK